MKTALFGLACIALAHHALADDLLVKIGNVAPLTGPQSHLGKDQEYGVRLALEDLEAKGVIIGGKKAKFQLMSEDDQADPRTGTLVAQRLLDNSVKGVIGHLNSGTTLPASAIYQRAGMVMISPSATAIKLTQQNFRNIFRTISNDTQQGNTIGSFASQLGKRIAVIDDKTAYGQGLADEAIKTAKAAGAQIVAREFTTDKSTDFTAILTKIKAQNPDVIVFLGMDPQGGPMVRQLKSLGIQAKFVTGDGGCTAEMLKLAGDAMNDKIYCTQPGLPVDKMPGGKELRARFKKRFNAEIQVYAPYAYDATVALVEAMKTAQSTEPAKYVEALRQVNFKGISGTIAFDAKGDIKDGSASVYQFRSGKWEPVSK